MFMLTATACVLAALVLTWRLVGCWDTTDVLVHVLGVLLVVSIALASVAAAVAMVYQEQTLASQIVLALVLAHCASCVLAAVAWPALQYRYTIPPDRRHLLTH